MKLQTITFAALIALSTAASAEFFDNGTGYGNGAANTSGYTNANGQGYGSGAGDVNGWGRGTHAAVTFIFYQTERTGFCDGKVDS